MSYKETDVEGDAFERPSKSERKREMHAIQSLAEELSALSDGELEQLGVSHHLIGELGTVRKLHASGARNRQIKHCAKLLLDEDLDELRAFVDNRQAHRLEINQRFHALERWRDRLIFEGESVMGELLDEMPAIDRQQLRQLIRAAQQDHKSGRKSGAVRKLFQLLREESELDED